MKRIFGLLLLCVSACTNTVDVSDGADALVQLDNAPKNCMYLYKIDVDASMYSHDDAIRYLKNRIVAQNKSGNHFWLERDAAIKNDGAIFGPEYKYMMTARVYDCGNKK